MKIIIELPHGSEEEWQVDYSRLPDWVNWVVIKLNGGVFAHEHVLSEGAGMCLRIHDERKEDD